MKSYHFINELIDKVEPEEWKGVVGRAIEIAREQKINGQTEFENGGSLVSFSLRFVWGPSDIKECNDLLERQFISTKDFLEKLQKEDVHNDERKELVGPHPEIKQFLGQAIEELQASKEAQAEQGGAAAASGDFRSRVSKTKRQIG